MSNSIIRAALESRLATWANAQNPKIPVAFEEMPFTKPTSGPFLESFLIPNVTIDKDVAGLHKRMHGIFQVNCWARSGRSMSEVERLSQNIIDLFPMLPKTGPVSIEQTPYASPDLKDSAGWVIVPVTILYRYEA